MFARTGVLSLALAYLASQTAALDLDVNSQDSIKSAAKTLAGSIVSAYKKDLSKDSIPGLFSMPYYWWEAGTIFNGLIDYSRLTGDSQYDSMISEALLWQLGDFNAFMPTNQTKNLGNEDQSTWGLAAMAAAEAKLTKPKDAEWVDYAVNVFNTQVARIEGSGLNNTCAGGLRWQIFTFNNGYNYMNAVSNGNFFLLASRLAMFTGNQTYSEWADKSYSWANKTGLISSDYNVFDGFSTTTNCSESNKIQWTYPLAVYTEGAALMYNLTNGKEDKWNKAVIGFTNASSIFWETSTPSTLIEKACENSGKCDIDQKAFKGIAIRSFARALKAATTPARPLEQMISLSAKGAANACTVKDKDSDAACSLSWTGKENSEKQTAADGNLGEVFSAMSAVQALLFQNATASPTGQNGTQNGTASGTAAPPQKTANGAGSLAASLSGAIAVAFVAAMSF